MRIFVAGPGGHRTPEFNTAIQQLEDAGYETETGFYVIDDSDGWATDFDHVGWALFALPDLAVCDGVAVLEGWSRSLGSCLEVGYASGRWIPWEKIEWWTSRSPVEAEAAITAGRRLADRARAIEASLNAGHNTTD